MSDTRSTNLAAQEALGGVLNDKDIERLADYFGADVVDHDPAPDQAPGVEGIKTFWTTFFTAFPDAEITPAIVAADDDTVTAVLDIKATHTGEFLGHAATGKTVTARGIQTARFADGKIVERWGVTDELGILQQIGAV